MRAGLLFLLFSLQQILALNPEVSVRKCCPEGQIYNSATKLCVQGTGESIIGKTIEVTTKITPDPLTTDSVNPLDNLELVPATLELGGTGLPSCPGLHLETHVLDAEEDSVLTQDGKLIVSKYENGIGENPGEFTTEFCVDLDASRNKMIAVMCDICKSTGKVCYNLCCPHGYHYTIDCKIPDSWPWACTPGSNVNFSALTIWDGNNDTIDNWRQRSDILFVAPKVSHIRKSNFHAKTGFSCPPERKNVFGGLGLGVGFKLQFAGGLQSEDEGSYESYIENGDDFCLGYTDGNSLLEKFSEYIDDESEVEDYASYLGVSGEASALQFFGCTEGQDATGKYLDHDDWCRDFKAKIHPVFFIISTVFLIITLFVYLAEESLRRSNVLFSRITMGFILNLIIALILFTVEATKSEETIISQFECKSSETETCEAKAYLNIYFFLAFYCWMNVMCFNIWNKFASMQRQSLDEGKKFIRYLIYAQGLPLVIVIIILIVDKIGQSKYTLMEDLRHFPNMGQYGCFLGNGIVGQGKPYFSHPIFIYFQLFMLIMQGANTYFLGSTMGVIRNAFINKKRRAEDRKEKWKLAKREFNTVAKLGVIMGVFWIGEFISTAIGIEHCDAGIGCSKAICYTQLVLDIPNLLAGFLIFLVTVFKKPVYLGLRKKAGELTSGVWKTQAERTGVSNIYSDSGSGTEMKTIPDTNKP